jgi:hypothetical protein
MSRLERLDQVLDELITDAADLKVTLTDENWQDLRHRLCNSGGMSGVSYGTTVREVAPCETKKGKPTRCFFCVWITRTEDGFYEYGCNT